MSQTKTRERIANLARSEKEAEARLSRADAERQKTWWDMTLGLAEVPDAELTDAYDAAISVLGCTRSYLGTRRQVGKVVLQLDISREEIAKLPPRVAIAWTSDLRRGADGMVAAMQQAAEEGWSLREFIKKHGGVPMATGKERFQPIPVSQLADMDDDEVSDLVTQRPEVAHKVFQQVGRQITEDHQNRVRNVRDSVEGGTTTLTTGELISRGLSLATAVDRWFREIERESLTDDQRRALAVAARKIINNATAAEAALGLPEDVVAALLTSEENS